MASLRNRTKHTRNGDVTYIGIHARRRDAAGPVVHSQGHNTPGVDYYFKAMDYFKAKYKSCFFLIGSDDSEWAQENLAANRSDAVVIGGSSADDMAVLTLCNHTIMSIGTYGWWAAYLAGGTTVYYNNHPVPGTRLARSFRVEDFYLPEWIGMG